MAENGVFSADDPARRLKFVIALASGQAVGDAAREAGVSTRTATRWRASPDVRAQVAVLQREALDRAAAALADAANEAVATLRELLAPGAPPVLRLRAASEVLRHVVALHDAVSLDGRLAALEARLDGPAR